MASLLYSCDYSALANTDLSAGGAHVIDGLTWYAKGNLVGTNTYTRNLVNGSGLSIVCAGGSGVNLGSNIDLDHPHWFLPFSQIPSYDSAEPMLVQARFKFGAQAVYAFLGVVDTTNDGTGLRAAVRAKDNFVGPEGVVLTDTHLSVKRGTASEVATTALKRGGTSLRENTVVAVQTRVGTTTGELCCSENLASGMPASPLTAVPLIPAGATTDPYVDVGSRSNPGICFAFRFSGISAHSVYLHQLQVWRLSTSPDTVDPTVTLVSPASMSTLQRQDYIVVDVTDPGLGYHTIGVKYDNIAGLYEVAFDGTYPVTYGMYEVTRVSITDGYRYTIRRRGGWPAYPRVIVRATDSGQGETL